MRLEIISKELAKAFRQRNQIATIGAIIALSNILLVGLLFTNKERVVVVPAQITNTMWTEKKVVSKEYLEEMVLFFSKLLLDATPHGMSYQRDVILRNVAPSAYNNLKHKLIKEEQRYREENLATTFRPTKILINTKKLQALITGYLTSFIAGKQVQQQTDTYLLNFDYDVGRLFIKSFEVEGK